MITPEQTQGYSGIYCHVPFCKSKCPYCNFSSTTAHRLIPDFLDTIKKEALLYQKTGAISVFIKGNKVFDTLYLGGGTPSILNPQQVSDLISHFLSCFPFTSAPEITFETNPGDFSPEYLKALLESGINRLTIGIQSFNPKNLAFLGRRHTPEQAKDSIKMARLAGFRNVGIDLIYGIPGQSLESWREELGQALEVLSEHISCYQLTIEEGTVFGRRLKEGKMTSLSEAEGYDFFITTSKVLKDAGYYQYEVSNFSRNEKFISCHNSKYWRHVPYLGLGPSAHSFDGNKRWWNYTSVQKYCESIQGGEFPREGWEELTQEAIRLESLYFAFRTCSGLDLERFERDFGQDLLIDPPGLLELLRKQGRVEVQGGWVMPTLQGLAVADALAILF